MSTTLSLRTVTIADAPSATVSVTASGAVPSGTVTVLDGTTTLGSAALVKGRATVALPAQTLGKHSLVAVYDGDEKVEGARAAAALLTVTPLPTSVVSASAPRTTTAQQAVVSTTVSAAGRAGTGEVSVVEGGQSLASGPLVNGRVALRLPALRAGRHELSIVHAGSANVTGGSKALMVVVAPATPTVTVALGSPTITAGSTGTVTVGVVAPGVEATGTVRLMRSAAVLDEVPLVGGRARLTVPADLPVGRYSLTVVYPGSSELSAASAVGSVTVVR